MIPPRDPEYDSLAALCHGFNTFTGDVVAVALPIEAGEPPLQLSNLSRLLDEAVQYNEAGELHSTHTLQGVYWILFDASNLNGTLAVVKDQLERRALLESARILTAEIGQVGFCQQWPEHLPKASHYALENVSPEFQAGLEKYLGLNVVCVVLAAGPGSTVWQDKDIAASLGQELQAAGAGVFDSSLLKGPSYFLFYHCPDLAKALQTLKSALLARELLNHAQILGAEPQEKKFQIYCPPAAGAALV